MQGAEHKFHRLSDEYTHARWNRELPPRLTIDPGDVVILETRSAEDFQLPPGTGPADLLRIDRDRVHPLTGPIFVRTAMPGDILMVAIERLVPGSYGVHYTYPGHMGLGLVPDHMPDAFVRHFTLDPSRSTIEFGPQIRIPLRPFLGIMGVARAEYGEFRTFNPGPFGGNMDIKDLTEGAILFLPVFVEGALFSAGDGHAAQGDGEVAMTAVECPMTATLRFFVLKGRRSLSSPWIETPEAVMTTGFGTTLDESAQLAVLHMIEYLEAERGLDRREAYALCSLAVDVRINLVVKGIVGVRAVLPKSLFSQA